jgi:hypothetical protein
MIRGFALYDKFKNRNVFRNRITNTVKEEAADDQSFYDEFGNEENELNIVIVDDSGPLSPSSPANTFLSPKGTTSQKLGKRSTTFSASPRMSTTGCKKIKQVKNIDNIFF